MRVLPPCDKEHAVTLLSENFQEDALLRRVYDTFRNQKGGPPAEVTMYKRGSDEFFALEIMEKT